jgi:hypothetical protein
MRLPVTGFAYFLDIDGTLVDLADTPRAVKLHPGQSRGSMVTSDGRLTAS